MNIPWAKLLPLIMQIVAILFGGGAIQQYYAAQAPGAYSSVEIAGVPGSSLAAGAVSLITLIGGWFVQQKFSVRGSVEGAAFASLASLYITSDPPDEKAIQIVTSLATHRGAKVPETKP